MSHQEPLLRTAVTFVPGGLTFGGTTYDISCDQCVLCSQLNTGPGITLAGREGTLKEAATLCIVLKKQ